MLARRLACVIFLGCIADGQSQFQIQDVRVADLPTVISRSTDSSDVLAASLETILHDRQVCCGKDSALKDSVERADPRSLKDVAAKLQGRHLLPDGRPIMVTADHWDPATINSGTLVATLRSKHALLLAWNSHNYVCYGVTFRLDYDPDTGAQLNTILKLMLLDTRYSDARREVVFNRETDDWQRVQGLMYIEVKSQ